MHTMLCAQFCAECVYTHTPLPKQWCPHCHIGEWRETTPDEDSRYPIGHNKHMSCRCTNASGMQAHSPMKPAVTCNTPHTVTHPLITARRTASQRVCIHTHSYSSVQCLVSMVTESGRAHLCRQVRLMRGVGVGHRQLGRTTRRPQMQLNHRIIFDIFKVVMTQGPRRPPPTDRGNRNSHVG